MKFILTEEKQKTFKDVKVGQIFLYDDKYWLKISEISLDIEFYDYDKANAVVLNDICTCVEYFSDDNIIEKIYTNVTINLA